MSSKSGSYPAGSSLFLLSLLIDQNPPPHIVIILKEPADIKTVIGSLPVFANAIIAEESSRYPLLNGETTYYICKNHACLPPVNELKP